MYLYWVIQFRITQIFWGGRQETFIKTAVSTNRDMPGNRDLLKVVSGRTQSLLRSCYHTFSKSLLGLPCRPVQTLLYIIIYYKQ